MPLNRLEHPWILRTCSEGYIAPIELLLAAKAPVDQTDNHSSKALKYASSRDRKHNKLAEVLEPCSLLTPLMLAVVT